MRTGAVSHKKNDVIVGIGASSAANGTS